MPNWLIRPLRRLKQAVQDRAASIALFAIVYCSLLAIGIAIGAHWASADAAPAVRVLGSGSGLSLLITSSNSRMLIATGDDATAFSNALAHAIHPTERRIDVLVLAGDDDDLAVANRASRDLDARRTLVLDGPMRRHLAELGLDGDDVISRPVTVHLPEDIDVAIDPGASQDGRWTASIRRGGTAVFVASDIDEPPDGDGTANAMIVAGGFKPAEAESLTAKLFVASSKAISAAALREAALVAGHPDYAFRIEPGNAVTLRFEDGGLGVPPSAIRFESP